MKKKIMGMALAVVMCVVMCVPVFAAASESAVSEPVVPQPDVFWTNTVGNEVTPLGEVHTVSVNVPADGAFHKIYPSSGIYELSQGSMTISGTWSPSYAELEFKVTAANGSSSGSGGISSGNSVTLPLVYNSTYTVYAKALDVAVSGLVNITTN